MVGVSADPVVLSVVPSGDSPAGGIGDGGGEGVTSGDVSVSDISVSEEEVATSALSEGMTEVPTGRSNCVSGTMSTVLEEIAVLVVVERETGSGTDDGISSGDDVA